MNIVWTCPVCLRNEKTTSWVTEVKHTHDNADVCLLPYKKPRKPAGAVTAKNLKKEVWNLFSEYIRRVNSDENGYCECVTCGKIKKWQEMQAGHFIHGTSFLIPELVHPQCPECNGFKAGNLIAYEKFMLKIYSQSQLDKFEWQAKQRHSFTIFELNHYKKKYQDKLKGLAK